MGRVICPVLVPTKGRAGAVSPDVLSLSPLLVVEPAEADAYRAAYPGVELELLPYSGRGIGCARNGVLALARRWACPWVWMLDDDLTGFFRVEEDGARTLAPAGEVLAEAEEAALAEQRIGAAALPVAWSKREGDLAWNRSVYCCVLLHVELLEGLCYSETLPLKEDTDFSLRVLSAGLRTLTLNRYGFQMPVCGSAPGGLQTTYAESDREKSCALELARRWPGVVSAAGSQVRVRWELFREENETGSAHTVQHRMVPARVSRFRPTALK